ncbi:MAG: hypothetical protein B7X50_08030 [Alishewanella sp. 34-51-39]|nr:MAG: hypothetical protein B7X50_08030 [Alishewanella sp. 34-51-39]
MLSQRFKEQALRINNPRTGTYGTKPDLIHAVLGYISEVNEFCDALITNDLKNALEELGDMFWFTALYESATKFHVEFAVEGECPDHDPITIMGKLADLLKAHYAYGAKKTMTQEGIEQQMAVLMGENLQNIIQLLANLTKTTPASVAEKAQVLVINNQQIKGPVYG